MDNKKILKQILKIDKKADIDHTHDGFLSQDDLPSGGYAAINIRANEWILSDDEVYYYANITHNLGTKEVITEAVSSTGELMMIGYNSIGDNDVKIISDEAIDLTVTVIHRAEPNSLVGFNPINDNVTNSTQTWSSKKIQEEIGKITEAGSIGGSVQCNCTEEIAESNRKIQDLQQEVAEFKQSFNNKMSNLVSYELDTNTTYTIENNTENTTENSKNINIDNLLKELKEEKDARKELEDRVLKLEKILSNIKVNNI